MWHGVPFACQRHPIVGVLRMCWLLPGSFDCFCCPHTSVHRPSIACLAVFLCGPGALFLHALSGPSTPPPPVQVLVQGAKVRKHGVTVFGQASVTARHVPRNTSSRQKPTLPLKT